MLVKELMTEVNQKAMVKAIGFAEKRTSGEIRVHFENKCKKNVLDRAVEVFYKLGMQKTEQKNGVLIYVALEDRKLAIIGDTGINEKVAPDYWDITKNQLIEDFKKSNITGGVCKAILSVGEQLKALFPYQKDDVNELSDEISYSRD